MKRTTIMSVAVAVLLGVTLVAAGNQSAAARANPNGAGRFTFALIGDLPYGAEGDAKFPALLADLNADKNLSFVVHATTTSVGRLQRISSMRRATPPILSGCVSRSRSQIPTPTTP